jgi:hypothetical protein
VDGSHEQLGSRFLFRPDSTLYLAGSLAGANGVYSSTNFGSTWSNLNTQLPNGPFSSVVVTPGGTIFTGCSKGVFRSSDGGTNWDHIAQTEIPFGASPLALTVTPKGTILARNGNSYFRSTDNGNTWQKSVALTIQIWPISATNILRQSDNGLERSTDDGVSWQSVPGSPKGLQYDLAIDQAGNIFTFYSYQLYISKDGGTTWSVDCTITGGGEELAFTQDHTLYFSQPSAGIWRTLKPLSGVQAQAGQTGMLLQWMPSNPIGQQLSFTLQTHSFATLTLFNILGEKVMTLAEGEYDLGEHRVSLPGNLLSGEYLCVLRAGGGSNTIKLLLQ